MTDLNNTEKSVLLAKEQSPVLKLLLIENEAKSNLWAATCSTNINCWPVLNEEFSAYNLAEKSTSSITNQMRRISHYGSWELESSDVDNQEDCQQLCEKPNYVIPGGHPIVNFHVCSEKRFIITKDSVGSVAVYDVLKAQLVEELGKVDFADEVKNRDKLIFVPNWFTVDLKCGMPMIFLDEHDCLAAWITVKEACLQELDSNPDNKVNYGVMLMHSLFENWLKNDCAKMTLHESENKDVIRYKIPSHTAVVLTEGSRRALVRFVLRDTSAPNEQMLLYEQIPEWVMVTHQNKQPKVTKIPFFLILLPKVTNGKHKSCPLSMSTSRNRLSANDTLQIRKVMEYVFQRMLDTLESMARLPSKNNQGDNHYNDMDGGAGASDMSSSCGYGGSVSGGGGGSSTLPAHGMPSQLPHPSGASTLPPSATNNHASSSSSTAGNPSAQLSPLVGSTSAELRIIAEMAASKSTTNPESVIEILCGDQTLDPNMSLRTVKHFFWKQPGDLVLHYVIHKQENSS